MPLWMYDKLKAFSGQYFFLFLKETEKKRTSQTMFLTRKWPVKKLFLKKKTKNEIKPNFTKLRHLKLKRLVKYIQTRQWQSISSDIYNVKIFFKAIKFLSKT